MKCQKIHFEKAYAPYNVSVLSMLNFFGIFAIYLVSGVLFCRFTTKLSLPFYIRNSLHAKN